MDWQVFADKVLVPIVVPILVVPFAGYIAALAYGARQRREKKADAMKTRAALLYMFSLNAVREIRRFAQYVGQGQSRALSFSRPFDPMTMGQFQKLAELGAPLPVLSTIYRVRGLNEQVTALVDRAHREFSKMSTSNFPNSAGPAYATFANTAAFIVPEWGPMLAGVIEMLSVAESEGVDVAQLRRDLQEGVSAYDAALAGEPEPMMPGSTAKSPTLKTVPMNVSGTPMPARRAQ